MSGILTNTGAVMRWKARFRDAWARLDAGLSLLDQDETAWAPDDGVPCAVDRLRTIVASESDLGARMSGGLAAPAGAKPGEPFGFAALLGRHHRTRRVLLNWLESARDQDLGSASGRACVEELFYRHLVVLVAETTAIIELARLIDPTRLVDFDTCQR